MTRWYLVKKDGLYYWEGSSCWGGGEVRGGYVTRQDAMDFKPLFADWRDMTGEEDGESKRAGRE